MFKNHHLGCIAGALYLVVSALSASEGASERVYWESVSGRFIGPLSACNRNYDDMANWMISVFRSYGNEPTEADLEEAKSLNWCNCLYEKVANRTREMEIDSVVSDMTKHEQSVREFGLLKGAKFTEEERQWIYSSLENGDALMTVVGLGLQECLFGESPD